MYYTKIGLKHGLAGPVHYKSSLGLYHSTMVHWTMRDDDNHRVSDGNCWEYFNKTCLLLTKRFRGPDPKAEPE